MVFNKALTVKTMLVFLKYIFQFAINKALPASNSVDRQNLMGKSVKDDYFNLDDTLTLTSEVRDSTLTVEDFFFFRKAPFSFLDRLKIYR